MGALLESGMVGNIGLKHLKVIKEDTLNKWQKLGFLDGLKGHTRENIAQLYENQATNLINEATSSDASGSFVGSSYGFATARDWARFGVLFKNDGIWEGGRILPEGRVISALRGKLSTER